MATLLDPPCGSDEVCLHGHQWGHPEPAGLQFNKSMKMVLTLTLMIYDDLRHPNFKEPPYIYPRTIIGPQS